MAGMAIKNMIPPLLAKLVLLPLAKLIRLEKLFLLFLFLAKLILLVKLFLFLAKLIHLVTQGIDGNGIFSLSNIEKDQQGGRSLPPLVKLFLFLAKLIHLVTQGIDGNGIFSLLTIIRVADGGRTHNILIHRHARSNIEKDRQGGRSLPPCQVFSSYYVT